MSNRMRVVKASDERLEFDNGLILKSYHNQRCCEINYLDFRDKNCEIIPKDPKSGEFAELFEGEC